MKDLIEITDKLGNKRQVELITKFDLDGYDYNYIIYQEIDHSHVYCARYKGENIVNLDTNLSEKEFNLAKRIYESVRNV